MSTKDGVNVPTIISVSVDNFIGDVTMANNHMPQVKVNVNTRYIEISLKYFFVFMIILSVNYR